MHPDPKSPAGAPGCNQHLLRAVPLTARRILEVGCRDGSTAAALKAQDPIREVFGLERDPALAGSAAKRLDQVFWLDPEQQDIPLERGSLDCILYGDILEHWHDPGSVLRWHRRLLAGGGQILCSIPNIQHHSILTALLQSDFQYTQAGLLDRDHLRFFTYSTIVKLLLDSGYAPSFVETVALPCSDEIWKATQPLLSLLGLHPSRTRRYLDAYQYIVRGLPLPYTVDSLAVAPANPWPLTLVACVSDEGTAQANLLRSPCLQPGSPHEVILVRNCRSAAEGLNQGLARAHHPLVVCLHQDVYLPLGWPERFASQVRRAEEQFGPLGVVGVYGAARTDAGPVRVGHVVDRDRLLWEPAPLPAQVETLDELLLAVPRQTDLSLDPTLGFHLYGADLCLAARRQGLTVVALDALCLHHSRSVGLPDTFFVSAAAFTAKWTAALPVTTACVLVEPSGQVRQW